MLAEGGAGQVTVANRVPGVGLDHEADVRAAPVGHGVGDTPLAPERHLARIARPAVRDAVFGFLQVQDHRLFLVRGPVLAKVSVTGIQPLLPNRSGIVVQERREIGESQSSSITAGWQVVGDVSQHKMICDCCRRKNAKKIRKR